MATARVHHHFRRLCQASFRRSTSFYPPPSSPFPAAHLGRGHPAFSSPPSLPSTSRVLFRSFSWGAPAGDSSAEKDGRVPELERTEADELDLSSLGLESLEGALEGAGGDSLWYAPVRALISALDVYHDLTGLPWWIVIATSTLMLRVSLLPVLILQFKKAGKLAEMFPKLPPPLPPPFSGISFREQFSLHRKKRKELGCPSYLWNFAYFSVQFPCFLLWMTSIRRMSLDGHTGFDSGGALWFLNLTEFSNGVCGPVFPILIGGLHFINVQISFQTLKVAKLPGFLGLLARYYKLYLDILSVPLFVIGFYVPQGSLVYWVTNSTLTLVQQLLIKNSDVRKKLGLPAINVEMENKIPAHGKNASAGHHFSTNSLLHENIMKERELSCDIKSLSSQELLELGLQHTASGDQERALTVLRLATEKDPDLVRALVAIGQILCSRKLLVEAAEYFERAIQKIQKDEEIGLLILALFGAGVSHILQGKRSESIQYLRRISKLKEPEAPMDKACYYQGLVMLASELFQQGEKSEAAEYLRRAAVYDPNVEAYIKECQEWLEERK